MTEPYPASYPGAGYSAPGPVARPATVNRAFTIYIAVAVVGLLSILATVLNSGALRAQAAQQAAAQGRALPPGAVDTIIGITIGTAVVGGLIGAALYILFDVFMRRGANWARIVLTVFSGLGILGGLFGLGNIGQTFGLGLLQLLLLIAGIVFMWLRPSNAYFAGVRANRVVR